MLVPVPKFSHLNYQVHFFDARDVAQAFHRKSFIRKQVALQVVYEIAFSIDSQSANQVSALIATIAYLQTSGM